MCGSLNFKKLSSIARNLSFKVGSFSSNTSMLNGKFCLLISQKFKAILWMISNYFHPKMSLQFQLRVIEKKTKCTWLKLILSFFIHMPAVYNTFSQDDFIFHLILVRINPSLLSQALRCLFFKESSTSFITISVCKCLRRLFVRNIRWGKSFLSAWIQKISLPCKWKLL